MEGQGDLVIMERKMETARLFRVQGFDNTNIGKADGSCNAIQGLEFTVRGS